MLKLNKIWFFWENWIKTLVLLFLFVNQGLALREDILTFKLLFFKREEMCHSWATSCTEHVAVFALEDLVVSKSQLTIFMDCCMRC